MVEYAKIIFICMLYVAISPKMSVSEFMSYLKGKSSLMIFDRHPEYRTK